MAIANHFDGNIFYFFFIFLQTELKMPFDEKVKESFIDKSKAERTNDVGHCDRRNRTGSFTSLLILRFHHSLLCNNFRFCSQFSFSSKRNSFIVSIRRTSRTSLRRSISWSSFFHRFHCMLASTNCALYNDVAIKRWKKSETWIKKRKKKFFVCVHEQQMIYNII